MENQRFTLMAGPILLQCPRCGRKLKAPANAMGKAVECPGCRQKFRVCDDFRLADEPIVAEVIEPPKPVAKKPKAKPKPRPRQAERRSTSRRPRPVDDDIEILDDDVEVPDFDDYDDIGDDFDDYDEYVEPRVSRGRGRPPKSRSSRRPPRSSGNRNSTQRRPKGGGRYVVYKYAISIVVLSFQRVSDPVHIRDGESAVTPGLQYLMISLLFGWWGFPWGPIFTIGSIANVFGGGTDVTDEMRRAYE